MEKHFTSKIHGMIELYSLTPGLDLTSREENSRELQAWSYQPGVFIHTCNRVEFYHGTGQAREEVVRHLFRVTSGLESHLVGEIAIQGQVKQAYLHAATTFGLDKEMHRLFQAALRVGKRVRTDSGISRGAMSHGQAAVEIICQEGVNLSSAIISLVGVHKMNEDIIRFLRNRGAETICLANKSREKAIEVANKHDCQVMGLDQLKPMLGFTDVLITATSAPHLIVKPEHFTSGKEMLVIDLAFPRDVDEAVGNLPGVKLYNLEDIEQRVNENLDKREAEVQRAQEIIEEELIRFFKKQARDQIYSSRAIKS
jgi:glutamyl-tRNA reductase